MVLPARCPESANYFPRRRVRESISTSSRHTDAESLRRRHRYRCVRYAAADPAIAPQASQASTAPELAMTAAAPPAEKSSPPSPVTIQPRGSNPDTHPPACAFSWHPSPTAPPFPTPADDAYSLLAETPCGRSHPESPAFGAPRTSG